jgi:RNA polymerase sigma-70 factor (ECF subfamily)
MWPPDDDEGVSEPRVRPDPAFAVLDLYESEPETVDPWDGELDAILAREVLGSLGAHHQAALTLRYVDGLGVPEVAAHLGRTVHATEALLVRARTAFRKAYQEKEGTDD